MESLATEQALEREALVSRETEESRSEILERYLGASRADASSLRLVTDAARGSVQVSAVVRQPLLIREALSALHEIVRSDLAYRPKDRSGYLAFRRARKQASRLAEHVARRDLYAWLARNDPLAWFVLDPVVTVAPDAILFEVFSKDESTYAQLSVSREALEPRGDWRCGTTNVDFTDALYNGLQHVRSGEPLSLEIGPDVLSVELPERVLTEKRVSIPNAWLRGFLQVQSSMMLAGPPIELGSDTLYNLLRHLSLRADPPPSARRGGRAVRVELEPGEIPNLALEPWEKSLQALSPYQGSRAEVVRIWGRRRWLLARRLMPFVRRAKLHVIGSGLPSFLVLDAGAVALTLGLTGFSASDWTRALQLDVFMPRPASGAEDSSALVIEALGERRSASVDELVRASRARKSDVISSLQALSQHGRVMIDLASDRVHLRPLLDELPQAERLRFRSEREREAIDLLSSGSVRLLSEEARFGAGVELKADVISTRDERTYRTSVTLDSEARVRRAECTCNHHRSHGLKEGPCAHLVALRLAQWTSAARPHSIETCTLSRREAGVEQITQLSLDKRRLKARFGPRGEELRVQSMTFGSEEEARAAYEERVAALRSLGFREASEG